MRPRVWRGAIALAPLAALVCSLALASCERGAGGAAPAGGEVGVAQTWTCSMHPQIRMPNPGNCPICGMRLVPAKEVGGAAVVLSAEAQQIASIAVEPVARHALAHAVRTVGRIEAAEPYVANLTARVAGRVERVYADSTGVDVAQGDHLVEIYSPDLVVAQEELLLGLRASGGKDRPALDERDQARVELAREKLRLFGVTDAQLAELEKSGKPQLVVTVHAPIGGTVVAKHVREQTYVQTGDPLYDIADLSHVWLLADVYEFELPWIVRGEHANVTLEALPGEAFEGVVAFVEPRVDDATRTIKVRIHLDNERRLLKPGMFAHVNIHARLAADGKRARSPLAGKFTCPMHPEIVAEAQGACSICGMALVREPSEPGSADAADVLAVPVTAVLDSGVRRIVWVEREPGRYESAEVVLGPRAGQRYPVLAGLSAGDRVVVHGAFLLDSQSQIEGKPSLLFPNGLGTAASVHAGHSGHDGH